MNYSENNTTEEIKDIDFKILQHKNIISVMDFDEKVLRTLFHSSDLIKEKMEINNSVELTNKLTIGCLFFEPSTRTMCSFQAAAYKLGGQAIVINDTKTSSVSKGESLSDTIKCLECYCDIIVLRHFEKNAMQEAIEASNIPIINAGDGDGEHPTQALLDLYTIYKEHGKINGLNITFVGDLKYGRTVHSLILLLCNNYKVNINLVCPNVFGERYLDLPSKYMEFIKEKGCNIKYYTSIDEVINETDVLYMTRIQKERLTQFTEKDLQQEYKLCLKKYHLKCAKENLIIMHPLPRVDEISTEIDNDPRAVYFKQMKYGLYVRMALLSLII